MSDPAVRRDVLPDGVVTITGQDDGQFGTTTLDLTAIAQHLSRTGNLIQIYSDPAIFDSRLELAT